MGELLVLMEVPLKLSRKIIGLSLRNGKRAACNHRVRDAYRRLLSTKEA